jgi:CheY-like chemotaxis protein
VSTVLVVDDMPIFRDPIAASLRLAGYETLCAADGAAALALARVRRPDAVLLDVSMPVMDGFAFLRDLRRDPTLADVPVILLTAASDRKFVIEAGRLGVKDYLLKSRFSLADLLSRVRKYAAPGAAAARMTPTG